LDGAIRELRTVQTQRRKEEAAICTNKPNTEEVSENGIRYVSQQPQMTQSVVAQSPNPAIVCMPIAAVERQE